MDNTIARLNTSCKECIFAVYDNNKQIGCDFGRLKNMDSSIQVVQTYDEEKEFYILNNTKCHYKRNKQWGKKVFSSARVLKFGGPTTWQSQVLEENKIKYQGIVFADNDFDRTKTTISHLVDQSIPPQKITVIRKPNNTISPIPIVQYLATLSVAWKIENIVDNELTDLQIVDAVLQRKPHPYYIILYSGHFLPQDFFSKINTQIYDNNLKFAVITHNQLPLLVSTTIHYIYCGNKTKTLIEKLEEDQCQNMIKDIQTIQQLPQL